MFDKARTEDGERKVERNLFQNYFKTQIHFLGHAHCNGHLFRETTWQSNHSKKAWIWRGLHQSLMECWRFTKQSQFTSSVILKDQFTDVITSRKSQMCAGMKSQLSKRVIDINNEIFFSNHQRLSQKVTFELKKLDSHSCSAQSVKFAEYWWLLCQVVRFLA